MNQWLNGLDLVWGKIIAVILYIVIMVWVWTLPKNYIMIGSPTNRTWRDLRIWASILMLIMILVYLKF